MKKRIFVIISVCTVLISGCSNSKSEIQHPSNISNGAKTISYYDTSTSESFSEFEDVIDANNDGLIRKITIQDSDIKTYAEICVGDDVNKVEDSFEYEYKITDNSYSVLFNSDTEVSPQEDNKDDSWLWINYSYEDNKITTISIYDVKYGREMR